MIINNFLNGKLYISVDLNTLTITGKYFGYDSVTDTMLEYQAKTICNANDSFSTDIGINIIKNKIAAKFYKDKKNQYKKKMIDLKKSLVDIENKYCTYNNKYESINKYLKTK